MSNLYILNLPLPSILFSVLMFENQLKFPKFLLFGDSITEYCFNQHPLTADEYAAAAATPQFNRDDPEKRQYKSQLVPDEAPTFSMGAALCNDYRRKMEIVHRGYAGYNSDQALNIIKPLLEREHDPVSRDEQFKLALVFFGSNDYRLTTPETGYMEGVPLERYVSNMDKVVQELRSRDIKTILVTPGLHDDVAWDIASPGELSSGTYRTNARGKQYGDALKAVAAKHSVPVIDMYALMMRYVDSDLGGDLAALEHGGLGPLLIDGIHFTGLAYKMLYGALKAVIADYYAEWDAERIPDKFPHWSLV